MRINDRHENKPDRVNGFEIPAFAPIGILGMGCRLPGNCTSSKRFWELLLENRDVHSKVPPDRFNIDAFYHPQHDRLGSVDADGGYFLSENVKDFDPTFFGIPAAEAITMDPQQRKVLEVAYEALESAGIPLSEISGTRTGCFVANFSFDFATMQYKDTDFTVDQPYMQTGLGLTLLSNRVSYVFNLLGPSLTVDTACSSSAYALHLACQAIAEGSCDGALVIGTNLILTADLYISSAKLGVLSPTSRCHSFDASADGYARAEAVNALYIKRLPDALADGNPIRAVIRSTSINANGKSPGGVTNPNPLGQEQVIRSAFQRANLDYNSVGYFECHGTGTQVGDPLEVQALGPIFAPGREPHSPLLLGSVNSPLNFFVKTNFGHAEAASGITSVMKCVYAVEEGIIPATLGVRTLNPNIDFKDGRLRVVTENMHWPSALAADRIASVNSFGYGGANAHVIIQETKSALRQLGYTAQQVNGYANHVTNGVVSKINDAMHSPIVSRVNGNAARVVDDGGNCLEPHQPSLLLVFSAHEDKTLKKLVRQIGDTGVSRNLRQIAYTLGAHRSKLNKRAFCVVDEGVVHSSSLDAIATFGSKPIRPTTSVAFVFTGQGSQSPQMALELLSFPVFLKTIRHLDMILQGLPLEDRPSWLIEDALKEPPETSKVNHVEQSQPLCTAVQLATVQLLWEWNVRPLASVGHSSGEIAAAYTAGLVTMDDAIKIAYYRGLLVSRNNYPVPGLMLAAGLPAEEAQGYARFFENRACVACVNSPYSVTISGDEEPVRSIAHDLTKAGVFNRTLLTNGKAYHSHHMKSVGPDYEAILETSLLHSGPRRDRERSARMFSSVTSKLISAESLPGSYWRNNLESPVLFSSSLANLLHHCSSEVDHLIEVGPHSALAGPIREILAQQNKADIKYSSVLVRKQNSAVTALTLAGNLFLHDYPIDIAKVNSIPSDSRAVAVDLPGYPWEYTKSYWNESRISREFRQRKHPRHDILGVRLPGTTLQQATWRNVLRIKDLPWLADHKAGGAIVFPTAGYLAMAAEAALQIHELEGNPSQSINGFKIENVAIIRALVLQDSRKDHGTELMVTLQKAMVSNRIASNSWYEFKITSHSQGDTWLDNCSGRVKLIFQKKEAHACLPGPESEGFRKASSPERWYKKFQELGLDYGPAFSSLSEIRANPHTKHASARTLWRPRNTSDFESRYFIHPAVLDACIHSILVANNGGDVLTIEAVQLPVSIDEVVFETPTSASTTLDIRCCSRPYGLRTLYADVEAGDFRDGGSPPALLIKGMCCRKLHHSTSDTLPGALESRTPYLRFNWKPDVTSLFLRTEVTGPRAVRKQACPSVAAEDQLLWVLDLIGHKYPEMSVLEIDPESRRQLAGRLRCLDGNTCFKRYSQYTVTHEGSSEAKEIWMDEVLNTYTDVVFKPFEVETDPVAQGYNANTYDVLILAKPFDEAQNTNSILQSCRSLLKPEGLLLVVFNATDPMDGGSSSGAVAQPSNWERALQENGFDCTCASWGRSEANTLMPSVTVARVWPKDKPEESARKTGTGSESIGLIYCDTLTALGTKFIGEVKHHWEAVSLSLEQYAALSDDEAPKTIIVLFDLERKAFLNTMTPGDLKCFQALLNKAKSIIWLSPGGLQSDESPDYGSIYGFSRSASREYPLSNFVVVSFSSDDPVDTVLAETLAVCGSCMRGHVVEREIGVKEGIRYIGRVNADERMNNDFQLDKHEEPVEVDYDPRRSTMVNLSEPGRLSTFYFTDDESVNRELGNEDVEIDVHATGLMLKSLVVAMGTFEADGLNWEIGGVIRRVGRLVNDMKPGDRVIGLTINTRFNNIVRTNASLVHKIEESESFEEMVSMLVSHVSAMHGLLELARLREGEKVLIQSASGALGQACIQIAKNVGAEIFATVGTDKKKEFLHDEFGIPYDHIFGSRDSAFVEQIKVVSGRGIDVVVATSSGEILHDTFKVLGHFGRLLELGRSDVYDHGRLDLMSLRNNISVYSFDFGLTLLEHPELNYIAKRHLATLVSLYREGKIIPMKPIRTFHITDVANAFRAFSQRPDGGKIIVKYHDSSSKRIKAKFQATPKTSMDANGSYIMVGCLGGLGRRLSMLMLDRGANSFVFLSRSGASTPEASSLIRDLRAAGAQVATVRGDVSIKADVETAFNVAPLPVKGVIHAAMVLKDMLFDTMTHDDWVRSTGPKIQGCLNLHNLLLEKGITPDFFVMLSSVSGQIGQTTQTNYGAANTFIDSLARHRRRLGLPAMALSLGPIQEIGHVSEQMDVKGLSALTRGGATVLDEEHFLKALETAILPQYSQARRSGPVYHDEPAAGLLISGMEPALMTAKDASQLEQVLIPDRRLSVWLSAVRTVHRNDSAEHQAIGSAGKSSETFKDRILSGDTSVSVALCSALKEQLCGLLLLEIDEIQDDRPIAEYGLDSLAATEFRKWIYGELSVRVGFLELLEPDCTLMELVKKLIGKVTGG